MPPARASLRLRALVFLMRLVVRPALKRTSTPEKARRDFARLARSFRAPPFLRVSGEGAAGTISWISAGTVSDGPVIFFLHGGGYIVGNPFAYGPMLGRLSRMTGVEVAAPTYRLAPEHPAPAGLDDARLAYGALMARGTRPSQIVMGGDSAGGGLALALLAELCAAGTAPAGVFMMSPWTDLTLSGDSHRANAGLDPLFPPLKAQELVEMVLGDFAPDDPRISPLFAAYRDPPPVFFQVGSSEILLDDTRRMAEVLRAAGGDVQVDVWPDAPHVWQLGDGYYPEARAALRDIAAFIARVIPSARRPSDS